MISLWRRTVYRCLLNCFKNKIERFEHLIQPGSTSFCSVFPKEIFLFEMPPKRKATAPKAKENPVPVEETEPEADEDFVDKKPRNRRGNPKKVKEVADEPEEVVEKKTRRAATTKKKVEEEVASEPEEVVEKKSRKAATGKSKVKEVTTPEPEEVVEKKGRKAAATKTKDNGTEPEKIRTTRKKKAEPEPLIEEPKSKGRRKAVKEEKDEEIVEKAASKAKIPAVKKGKSNKKEKAEKDDKKSEKEEKVPLNKTTTDWETIDFTCSKKNDEGMSHNLIISCWNVGGLKSWVKKDCLKFLDYEKPDILCVQETKCSEEKLPDEIKELKLYKQYWCSSEKEGYAGVGIFTIKEPMNVSYGIDIPELDEDGRCITAEYNEFYLVCVYVPNAGRKLVTLPKRLEWNEAFRNYIKDLDSKKPVIICGDMNVAHNEIDLARPQSNTKNAGFTPEEREGMTEFLGDGYVDTFRKFYPEKTDVYTFWTYMANARAKNVGWRLDYFIVSERITKKICDNIIRTEVSGSDHCPITLFININAEGPRSITQ